MYMLSRKYAVLDISRVFYIENRHYRYGEVGITKYAAMLFAL